MKQAAISHRRDQQIMFMQFDFIFLANIQVNFGILLTSLVFASSDDDAIIL